jgi:hypothetical protein
MREGHFCFRIEGIRQTGSFRLASRSLFPSVLRHNPIMRAELAYQRRHTGQQRPWSRRLTRAVLLLAVFLSLILYGGELFGALLWRDPSPIGERFGFSVTLLMVFTLALHFVLMFRTLALGANSIAREKQNNTWDMLVLTGIDGQQIVLGKWWATARRMWRWYVLLGVLRAGALVWISGSASRTFNVFYSSNASYPYAWSNLIPPSPANILLAGVIGFALTMANLAFTAACGVSSSGDARSSAMAMARAIMMRLVTLVIAALLLVWLSALLATPLVSLAEFPYQVGITLLDNGASLVSDLAAFHSSDYWVDFPAYPFLTAILSLGAYTLLTWAMLQTAQRRAVRQRALAPARAIYPLLVIDNRPNLKHD